MRKINMQAIAAYMVVIGLLVSSLYASLRWNDAVASYETISSHDIRQDNLAAQIFDLQHRKQWARADESLSQLDDAHPLKAYALAQRLMDSDYSATPEERHAWMVKYKMLPVAKMLNDPVQRTTPIKPSDILFNAARPTGWTAAIQLFNNKQYALALSGFKAIAERSRTPVWYKSAALFWQARAADAIGEPSEALYRAAAKHGHTLYGILAQQHLKEQTVAQAQAQPPLTDAEYQQLLSRVILLKKFNELELLEHEVDSSMPRLTDDQVNVLFDVAAEYNIDVDTILSSRYRHTVSGYNVPEWFPMDAVRMDKALILGVVRQESKFNPNARNASSGATGLMQLLPQTARYVVNRYQLNEVQVASLAPLPISPVTVSRIREPKANIILGQHYLSYLAQKSYINYSLIHTLAAYNAGPANLIKWQSRFANISDPLLFMEMIPYRETRQYVIQVLANQMVYQRMEGGNSTTAASLLNGQWPQVKPL